MITEIRIPTGGNDLKACVDRFAQATVLVVGDIIMDQYVWGDVSRISPEAPVPVVAVNQETTMLGGAANVVNNIAALGGKPILCGLVGGDRRGRHIRAMLEDLKLRTDGLVTERNRPTSIKTRVVAHSQQVVRFDRESVKPVGRRSIEKMLHFVETNLEQLSGVVVADYGKGAVSASLMKGLRALVQPHAGRSVIIAVDPKTGNFDHYRQVDVITPNHHEAGAYCGFEITDEKTLIRAGRKMLKELKCRSVLITQGKDGVTLFQDGGETTHIPTVAKQVFDVTGAGDTVISTFSLALASGMDPASAAVLSNFAAGVVVGQVGTTAVRAADLKKAIDEDLPVLQRL